MTKTAVLATDQVAVAKARAAAHRLTVDPAILARAAALTASVPDLLTRCFVGPATAKGRQAMFILPAVVAA